MATAKQVIEGLQILDKYEDNYIAAEHDILYAGPSDASKITPEDQAKLDELGWHIDSETDSWARFV